MKRPVHIKLDLSTAERKQLRMHKIKISQLLDYGPEELAALLNIPEIRARELYALAAFQQIPTVGIEFAKDLIFLGYYRIEELKGKSGATLLDQFEKKKGYFTDPCVEDQFRLAVHFATYQDDSKKWWDFTAERKTFRLKNGYPTDRPEVKWIEVLPTKRKNT